MKDLLFKMWYDTTKPNQVALLLGDYHQLGIWMAPGGRVVAFDPAPTLEKGALTKQRIDKGNCYCVLLTHYTRQGLHLQFDNDCLLFT